MKRTSTFLLIAVGIEIISTLARSTSFAIPAFARKEGVSCTVCHTAVPKLTRTGFEYRAAGYRMPDKIGVDQTPKEFGEMMTFRGNEKISATQATGASPGVIETVTGGTIYAFAGSWGTNFGSLSEISLNTALISGNTTSGTSAPQVTVPDLQFRAAFGQADTHWNFRAGLPNNVLEGYGAMDSHQIASAQSIAPIAPYSAANTYKWSTKAYGTSAAVSPELAVGYTYYNTFVDFAILNGLEYDGVDGKLHPNGAGYSNRNNWDPLLNSHDYELQFVQFIGKNNAISGYYYSGAVSLPVTNGDANYTKATGATSVDTFSRAALYGTYYATDALELQLGVLAGTDNFGSAVSTTGGFVLADYYLDETQAVGIRYDMANPSSDSGYNQWQTDLYWTRSWKQGFYVKVDYSDAETGSSSNGTYKAAQALNLAASFMY